MALSLEQFGKATVSAGLATPEELKALWASLPPEARPKDGDALAQLLVERGKLSGFQAKHLAAGRGGGLVFGEYVLVDEIGVGGMGKVYKAEHRRMSRTVALKVLSPAAMKDEAAVRRFQREAHAAAKLEHENIVTAYDAGQAGTTHFLVMQFVDGGDLAALVRKNGPLPIETAVNYIVQAARGLSYAHAEGIVHRDIKPANLLLDKKGVVKILDMGLARIEGVADGLTGADQVMGTADYMSPEQASETRTVDARSDVYSLGCTLWYLLTGKKLYEGESMVGRLMKHRDAPLPSLVQVRDDAPWGLEQALHKMLAKTPGDRLQTMDEVIAALEPYAGDVPAAGSSIGMGSSVGMGGSRDAELSQFLKSIPPASGSSSKITAKPKSDSKLSRTAFSAAQSETDSAAPPPSAPPDEGVFPPPRRRPMLGNAPVVPQIEPRYPVRLILGAAATLAVGVGLAVWLLRDDDEAPVEPAVAVAADSGSSASTTGAAVADDAESPPAVATATTPPISIQSDNPLHSPEFEWSEPENLGPAVNSRYNEMNPFVSADGLTLLFDSNRPGGVGGIDLWMSRRPSPDASWEPAVNLGPTVNSSRDEYGPCLSKDGLTLYYSGYGLEPGYGGSDICYKTRKSLDGPWSDAIGLPASINGSTGELFPELSADELSLYFDSGAPGGFGRHDIWQSTRKSVTHAFAFSGVVRGQFNSSDSEHSPTISADERVIIFWRASSTGGSGGFDLWMSSRTSKTGPWSPAVNLGPPVNSKWNEDGPHLSPDGMTLYFASQRSGSTDLWMSRRIPKTNKVEQP
jgi:serine/threonine protein kinase